jgi:hypothetical protein
LCCNLLHLDHNEGVGSKRDTQVNAMSQTWKLIGTVDGKEIVISTGRSLKSVEDRINYIYDETDDYLYWDELYIRDPKGLLYITDEVDGGWVLASILGRSE